MCTGKKLAAFLGASLLTACAQPVDEIAAPGTEDSRPNIVFVLVDDLRWDELGVAGHPYVQTPNIDRIAHEGAYFSRAFTTTPLCSPSRATFLTGLYPHTKEAPIVLGKD